MSTCSALVHLEERFDFIIEEFVRWYMMGQRNLVVVKSKTMGNSNKQVY